MDLHERRRHGLDQRRESAGHRSEDREAALFQTPIDEEDAAARCVAPVLEGIDEMLRLKDAPEPPFGKFFKDYRESEW